MAGRRGDVADDVADEEDSVGAGKTADRGDRAPLIDLVLHPVRLRILQAMAGREVTTAQLRDQLPDVTPATLYRHVSALLDADVLTVVSERKVRGAVERTMAIGPRDTHVGIDEAEQLGPDRARQAFAAFLGAITGQVDGHLTSTTADLWSRFGFGATVLHIDDADRDALQAEVGALIARHLEPADGKDPVMFATVLVPNATAGTDVESGSAGEPSSRP